MSRGETFLQKASVVLLCAAVLCASSVDALRILSPPSLQRTYLTPEFLILESPKPVTGPLIVYNQAKTLDDIRGKVVLLQANLSGPISFVGVRNDVAFPLLAPYEPLGVIFTHPTAVDGGISESLIFDPAAWKNLTFPVVEIGYRASAEIVEMVEKNNSLIVAVDIGDFNIWRSIRRGGAQTAWQAIFTLWAGAVCVSALIKLIGFVRAKGIQFNIAQICLSIELICNLYRMIYFALDPIYAGRLFLAYQAHMMLTISWPFTIITTLLITLYWLELLTKNRVLVPTFLSFLKWPFLGVSLFMVALELGTSIARALSLGPLVTLTPIIGACYAVILVSTILLFFIVGTRTLRQLKAGEKIATQTSGSKRILAKTTKLIMVSGIFSMLWILGTLFTVIRPLFWDYRGFYATWTIAFGGILGTSLTQVLSFTAPSLSNPNSSRGTGSHQPTTVKTSGAKTGGRHDLGMSESRLRSSSATADTNGNTDENQVSPTHQESEEEELRSRSSTA
eukprot:TRINITY_DN7133_c0_g1_i1.p1 TRINITY_DN7133_c0_g1~~TRINITY_DN7133_c0_g1_i1.p1  ORF type:complete len:558 (+),score=65.63 TRINITY_DN7133_c0_g1_i1:155-1675(+)